MARLNRLIVLIFFLLPALPVLAQDNSTCATPMTLFVDQLVYTRPGVFIRNLPTISGGQVGYYAKSVTLRVVGGPVCADGINWWQVRTPGNPGWVAEADNGLTLLFPDLTFNNGNNCAPALGMAVGSQATLLAATRMREEPSRSSRVFTTLPANAALYILAGPTCGDGINWWQVRAVYPSTTSTIDGWVAEGASGAMFISPGGTSSAPVVAVHCSPPYYRLSTGIRAVVTYQDSKPKNLRAEPGLNAAILASLLKNIEVDIIGGPTCVDGLNWWQIRVVGQPDLVGWLATGGLASNQWLRPLIYN